ncbi:hypothetical protein [Izhakiella australiensis]|uniref:hypothetical protein n=1 Tax=Izhakiella australiensis TaxID=1926881 RepID=UPI0015904488|nr:hypothetical protein [Izhakiella australiensis]
MNARERRAQRYRERCKRLNRKLTEAISGCSWRVAKATGETTATDSRKGSDNKS